MEIRSLQAESVEKVLQERKRGDFASLADFLQRTDIPFADTRVLIRAGCFDELEPEHSRPELLLQLMEHQTGTSASTQVSSGVLSGLESQLRDIPRINGKTKRQPALRPLNDRQLFDMEVESFGYPITSHPLDPFREQLAGRTTPAEDIPRRVGHSITLVGVCLTTKTVKTRQGEAMEFLTFEDQTGLFECVLFPAQYKLFNDLVRWEKLFLIRGKVEEAWGVYTVTIEKMASLRRALERDSGKISRPEADRREKPGAAN
jgi:error-prone DNA polymerase